MNRRDGNTGMATMSLPLAIAMSSDENDISHSSNSSNFSWRQNVSDGSEFVHTRSTPSIFTSPERSGAMRSLLAEIKLSCRRSLMRHPSLTLIVGGRSSSWIGLACSPALVNIRAG